MTKREFYKSIDKPWIIIHKFVNEFNEEYALLKCELAHPLFEKTYFIAGDETEWEILTLSPDKRIAYKEFIFNKQEVQEIKRGIGE